MGLFVRLFCCEHLGVGSWLFMLVSLRWGGLVLILACGCWLLWSRGGWVWCVFVWVIGFFGVCAVLLVVVLVLCCVADDLRVVWWFGV